MIKKAPLRFGNNLVNPNCFFFLDSLDLPELNVIETKKINSFSFSKMLWIQL